jgi:hypothetical protein
MDVMHRFRMLIPTAIAVLAVVALLAGCGGNSY